MTSTAHPASFWGPEAARVAAREEEADQAAAIAVIMAELAAQARLIDEDA